MAEGHLEPADSGTLGRVQSVMAQCLGCEAASISGNACLKNGDWDSLTHVEILSRLSEEFSFDITPQLVLDLTSISAIMAFLRANPKPGKD